VLGRLAGAQAVKPLLRDFVLLEGARWQGCLFLRKSNHHRDDEEIGGR
jgi:hypothetical protein